ncbi:MAG: porphobilinogen synthase [Gemmatimonadaceae bacterium]|nr:porphobilinogen synthase [Gemmatimonadaceae bacterium]
MTTPVFARHTRLRRTPALRALLRETQLEPRRFIAPVFVTDDDALAGPIAGLPGIARYPVRDVAAAVAAIDALGVGGILLFGVPGRKDDDGSGAVSPDGVVARALATIRGVAPGLVIAVDVCRCQFAPDGQCAVMGNGGIDTDASLDWIGRASVAAANAGATLVAPSGMIDGAVQQIRGALDRHGHGDVGILSYAVKHASGLYGPFREAARSAPGQGDRRSHQLDPSNAREALREAASDVGEGADILMVKPALTNLDTLVRLRATYPGTPLAAFEVSGEYAMVRAAADRGWLDERTVALEALTAVVRAGADIVVTYRAVEAARWLQEDRAR